MRRCKTTIEKTECIVERIETDLITVLRELQEFLKAHDIKQKAIIQIKREEEEMESIKAVTTSNKTVSFSFPLECAS